MSKPPAAWREDLAWTLLGLDAEGAEWIANLNEAYPWRCVVGDIRLSSGSRIVVKWHKRSGAFVRERAAGLFLANDPTSRFAPELLGANADRQTLAFAHIEAPDLFSALEGPEAPDAWRAAARAVARLHNATRSRVKCWLTLCPADSEPEAFPGYDLPDEEIIAPFLTLDLVPDQLHAALQSVRQAMAEPRDWWGFIHGDLQTRHLLVTGDGLSFVDWECAGLGHRLFDLACLLAKPIGHGRRLPGRARDAAIRLYARETGVDPERLSGELAPVLAYEHLIGVAESYEQHPAEARAELEGIANLAGEGDSLALLRDAATALRSRMPPEDLPFFGGLQG